MSIHNVEAYMNHGRWVADCPGPCYEGAVTVPGFACDECRELGHHVFVVPLLPLDATEIEEAMCLRPEARTRNWRSETVEELHRETRDLEREFIETQLDAMGARMMRPYEHWGEEERYYQWQEEGQFGHSSR